MSVCGTRLLCFDCVTGTICESRTDSQAGNEAIWPMFYRAVSSKREFCFIQAKKGPFKRCFEIFCKGRTIRTQKRPTDKDFLF